MSVRVRCQIEPGGVRVTHVHGQDAAGDELPVLPDAEVPRLYPHHVVEHELQVQPPLHTHLVGEGQRSD